ncbi:MAG: alpha/beta hydrolase [Candidatus Nanopelagicales bacterium]
MPDAVRLDPEGVVRAPGPWTHRDVAANGARFHVVERGRGPMVLLLHGFPMFWWTWRRQLVALADAGYRAVAMDLRGYGGSDHPPHGYDPFTLSGDVAGVIRSLGSADAVVVGHGWGGFVAWSMAVLEPDAVRGIVPVSMPHPQRLRAAFLGDGVQRRRSRYALGFQWPFLPERSLTRRDAERVGQILTDWSATPEFPDEEASEVYRTAFQLWPTAHCAVEYHRWAVRSILRRDGRGFMTRMEAPVRVPVLQVHGAEDPTLLVGSVRGSEDFVEGPYRFVPLDGVGHFPQEEVPATFTRLLQNWLAAPVAG